MNWVGGARNRVKFQGDRRIQKEFFERKKLDLKCEKLQRASLCHTTARKKKHISQDLVALRTVSDASVKAGRNTVQNVKQVDLDRRPLQGGKLSKALGGRGFKTSKIQCERVNLPFSPELVPSKLDLLEAEVPRNACVPAFTGTKFSTLYKPGGLSSESVSSFNSLAPGNKHCVQRHRELSPSLSLAPQTLSQSSVEQVPTGNEHFPYPSSSKVQKTWPHLQSLWVSEDFQASPIIPDDIEASSLSTPYLSFPPNKPESAKRFTHTGGFEDFKALPAPRFSSPTTPSPDLWKTNPRGRNLQCMSASRVDDRRQSSPLFKRPWSDSETSCKQTEKGDRRKQPTGILTSRNIASRFTAEDLVSTEMTQKRNIKQEGVSYSQQSLVPGKDRRFEWDTLFLSQPVRPAGSPHCLTGQSPRENRGVIELGTCISKPTHIPVPSASKCMTWTKKENQVAETLLELDQLEGQAQTTEPTRQQADKNTSRATEDKLQDHVLNKMSPNVQMETDRAVLDVVENLIHSAVLSLAEHPSSSAVHIPSAVQEFQPVSVQSTGHTEKACYDKALKSDTAVQTEWQLIGVEHADLPFERRCMVDACVQWETPPSSQVCTDDKARPVNVSETELSVVSTPVVVATLTPRKSDAVADKVECDVIIPVEDKKLCGHTECFESDMLTT